MLRAANNYWLDERIRTQRALPRTAPPFASIGEVSLEIIGTRAEVRRRGGIIPSWVIFGMILLAALAVCVTVNLRTWARLQTASEQYALIQTDIDTLRRSNKSLRNEVDRLRNDPRAIESAARSRLHMVRSNEIVVPVE